MVVLLALVLFRFRPEDRRPLYNTLGFYLIAFAGQFVSAIFYALNMKTGAAVLHEAFVIAGGVAVIRLWGALVFRVLLPAARLVPPGILEDILVMMAYIAWGMVRLRYAGLDLSGIVTTSAVITAVIAFSMQDTLGNILGGIALQMENSIEIGDWIKVDDVTGKVVDIRWRSTAIETRNWETVVIPNSQLMKNRFVILGRHGDQPTQLRRWVWFNVDFSVAPARVCSVVESAVRGAEIRNVAGQPEPNCVLMDFDHGYGRYALRYWLTDLLPDDPTDGAIRAHIYAALNRAGIRLAVPEYNIHTVKEGEKHVEAVRSREMVRRIEALRRVDLFSKLSEDELKSVADGLKYSPFAHGDTIMRQGDTAHWLYIITAGEADVYLEAPGQDRRHLTTLPEGSMTGEMGLMTGAPRRATVIARSDVECYRLDKSTFENILRSRPAIADEISQILALRSAALEVAQQDLGAQAGVRQPVPQHGEILGKIRKFFGLSPG
ncbi:MAG: mechanosensitive ion channel [Betaproteobacteria bacterium]|nr:mechanosensitive ion channel [Betaproteobacteria bacterium]